MVDAGERFGVARPDREATLRLVTLRTRNLSDAAERSEWRLCR